MELRAFPSPAVMLRRQVASFRRDRLGLEPRDGGALSGSDAHAVLTWLHHGESLEGIAHYSGLDVERVRQFLHSTVDPVDTADSARVRGLALLGDYWPRASTGALDA